MVKSREEEGHKSCAVWKFAHRNSQSTNVTYFCGREQITSEEGGFLASLRGCMVRGESSLQRKGAVPLELGNLCTQTAHGLKGCER